MLEVFPKSFAGKVRVALLLSVIPVALLTLWLVSIRMPGKSHTGPIAPPTASELAAAARLEADVRMLAETIGWRNDQAPERLEAAAQYIEGQMRDAGLNPVRQSFRTTYGEVSNIEGVVPGTDPSGCTVVVGGHYDTMDGSPGADDNASGTAATLEMARALGRTPRRCAIRYVAFVNEEPPYFETAMMGSEVYAARARAEGWNITAMFSLETIGYFTDVVGSQKYPFPFSLFYPSEGNFIAFVGDVQSRQLVVRSLGTFRSTVLFPSAGLAAPQAIQGVDWSDHAAFWRNGYRALMVTDTAPFRNPNYHLTTDTADTLDYQRLARVCTGLVEVLRHEAEQG